MPGILDEADYEREVFHATESVRNRAVLLSHDLYQRREMHRLRLRLARAEEEFAGPVSSASDRTRIVSWLRATNATDTVRAKYARRLADLIEAGEDRKG